MTPKNAEELEADLWRRTMERHDITREQIHAVLTALRDAGVALVPREPTQEMLAAVSAAMPYGDAGGFERRDFAEEYATALAASPYEEG